MTVIRLGEKAGSRALGERNVLETVGVASEFVCTDSDVVPAASCPGTVVQHLQGLLDRYPEVPKIGLALRLDSIPPRFRHGAAVLRCEAQFWRRPARPGPDGGGSGHDVRYQRVDNRRSGQVRSAGISRPVVSPDHAGRRRRRPSRSQNAIDMLSRFQAMPFRKAAW